MAAEAGMSAKATPPARRIQAPGWRGLTGLAGRFDQLSVRHKLLALVLLPLLLVLPALGVVLLTWSNLALDRLLITKIRSDLAVAHGYFDRVRAEVGSSTAAMAGSQALHQTITQGDPQRLVSLLQTLREREGLDFIQLRRPDVLAWGDLAIRRGVMEAYGLPELPDRARLEEIAECWRPHRTAACRVIWWSLDGRSEESAGEG